MKKNTLILALAASLTLMPTLSFAQSDEATDEKPQREQVEDINTVSITVKGSQVHVAGAANEELEVYSLTGSRVTTVQIDSDNVTLNLKLQKGYYILKIGRVVRKISIA